MRAPTAPTARDAWPLAPGVRRAVVRGVEVTFLVSDALFAAIEASAWDQLEAALHLPGLERAIVTPDVHTGYAVPIGFTAVSRSHLYPDTVGPDPACSVSLSVLDDPGFDDLDRPARRAILDDLQRAVGVSGRHARQAHAPGAPLPFDELWAILRGRRRTARTWPFGRPTLDELAGSDELATLEAWTRDWATAKRRAQLRTIGGGNHFLEVQRGDDGRLYVMAHFGSRGLGATGADAFERRIRDEIVHKGAPADLPAGLLFAPADHPLGRLYFLFQTAMLDYAAAAHALVQEAAREVLSDHLGVADGHFVGHIPHNFIERRQGAYWQRKGATPAYDHHGIPLMIPGSMATTSYLLEPGPNAERWGPSVPHGAGRVLSRGAARRALDQAEVDAQLARRGALTNVRHAPIDESAGAYKDVDEVVAAVTLSGVARVTRVLTPLLILKGA